MEAALYRLKTSNARIVFASAENVLMKRSSHYAALIKDLREQNGYKNVVEQERVGNEKIEQGVYDFAQPTFREYILGEAA